jgi:hypothetical protein
MEIAADRDLKWFEVKNKWVQGARGWIGWRGKVQSVRGIHLITRVQSV